MQLGAEGDRCCSSISPLCFISRSKLRRRRIRVSLHPPPPPPPAAAGIQSVTDEHVTTDTNTFHVHKPQRYKVWDKGSGQLYEFSAVRSRYVFKAFKTLVQFLTHWTHATHCDLNLKHILVLLISAQTLKLPNSNNEGSMRKVQILMHQSRKTMKLNRSCSPLLLYHIKPRQTE